MWLVLKVAFALFMALLLAGILRLRRARERSKIRGALRAQGATVADDGSALEVSQTIHAPLAGRPPTWSATAPGTPSLGFYQVSPAPIVLAWKSARQLDVSFALTSRRVRNPGPGEYRLLDPRQLGVDSVLAYTLESCGGWLLTTQLPKAFDALFGRQKGVHFLYEHGTAYVFSADTDWHDLSEAHRIVRELEAALADAPEL